MKAAFVLVVCPALAIGLFFMFSATNHAHASTPKPAPFSCASEMASLAPLDAGDSIAPLCGATPYQEETP